VPIGNEVSAEPGRWTISVEAIISTKGLISIGRPTVYADVTVM